MEKSGTHPSRRKFLNVGLGALGTILFGGIVYPVVSYLVPSSKKGQKAEVRIQASEVPLGGSKKFHIGGAPAIVVHTKDGFVAFSLVCSHLGCLVNWETAKSEFLCPCHGAVFDINGHVVSGPPPTGLEPFETKVVDGEVIVS